jgi:hypothetical protein
MRKITKILSFFVVLPLLIGVENDEKDSTETNFKIAVGQGSYAYVTRGCEGEVLTKDKIPFTDFGFSADHKFKSPIKIGLRSGYISDEIPVSSVYYDDYKSYLFEDRTNFYFNPDFSLEWKWFGIGAGPFFAQKTLYGSEGETWGKTLPSGHIRLGTKSAYISINMLENVPLYSGGGYLDLGYGVRASRNFSFWLGMGTSGPYDYIGFVAKTNLRLKGNLHFDLAGRLGSSEGISENAISMGLNYRMIGGK